MASVRYIVDDVEKSIEFYCEHLGFSLVQQFGPAMAIVAHEDLRLWLAGPASSAAKPMPNGDKPQPGGWGRLVITVEDLDAVVSKLSAAGITFRNSVVAGPGGQQILCDDPSGNAVELFQPSSPGS